jgi:hypothetical protein
MADMPDWPLWSFPLRGGIICRIWSIRALGTGITNLLVEIEVYSKDDVSDTTTVHYKASDSSKIAGMYLWANS